MLSDCENVLAVLSLGSLTFINYLVDGINSTFMQRADDSVGMGCRHFRE